MGIRTFVLLVSVLLLFCTSCSKNVAWYDAKERKSTLIQRAQMKEKEGDIDAAIVLYIDALERNPDLARAHLDAALLLHGHAKDYVGAIYHYSRYLSMRPESEKRSLIEHRIRLASQDFAGGVLENGRLHVGTGESVADLKNSILALERENDQLKKQVAEQAQRLGVQAGRAAEEAANVENSTVRKYRVQKGDSLPKLSIRFYGDASRWPRIYFANKDKIDKPGVLPAGILLTIPQIESSSEE